MDINILCPGSNNKMKKYKDFEAWGKQGRQTRTDNEAKEKQNVREKMYEFHGKVAVDFFTENKSLRDMMAMYEKLKKNRGL